MKKLIRRNLHPKRKRRASVMTPKDWPTKFFESLVSTANKKLSAEVAGVSLQTIYNYDKANKLVTLKSRDDDDGKIVKREVGFADVMREVLETVVMRMEDEAYRRGVEGYDKPVYQNGMLVGRERKYSDTLLIFLMKAHKPDKYRERFDHAVKVEGQLSLTDFVRSFGGDGDDDSDGNN